METATGSRTSTRGAGQTDYREFFRALSKVVEDHPDEVAAFEEHLRRYGRPALTGGTLAAAATQHQEIIDAFVQTEKGRAAAQVLGEAYSRLAEQTRGAGRGDTPPEQIVPIIIGGLIILDALIWGCVFTDCL